MILVHSRAELESVLAGKATTLVPTMGALHEGHLSLVRAAKELGNPVVVSIFVNPKQFGPSEDFTTYPRTLEDDLRLLEAEGVDVVFAPDVDEVFPAGHQPISITLGQLDAVLEGAARPGHFAGVVDVVGTLFTIVKPTAAIFGEKDLQQLAVVRRLATEQFPGIQIHAAPIVREPDGLALSSRNRFLSEAQRKAAPSISSELELVAKQLAEQLAAPQREAGDLVSTTRALLDDAQERINAHGVLSTEYLELVDPNTFEILDEPRPGAYLATVVRAGATRLLDNRAVGLKP